MVLVCWFISSFVFAQSEERILIVSYAPSLHFSDCDNTICEKNKISKPEWRKLLQQKVEQGLLDALSYRYTVVSLYLSLHPEDQKLFKDWHNLKFCYYKEAIPTRLEESSNLEHNYVKLVNFLRKNSSILQEKNKLCWQENLKETKYLQALPSRSTLLDSIAQIFNVEKILLLTQIEIKTNYQVCVATDGTRFDRSVKLHYCLYSPKNELLYGDVAVSKGKSNTNDIESFFEEHIGYLSYYVLSTIEKK
ncbi:MAG: hypothetical protein NZ519_05910 [Bacteroidia bacterium]|nr:hypothetical protein [Bacteroidia bacterium]